MTVKCFRDLTVWQKSMDLVCSLYEITKLLPPDESFSLTNQMRRCAVSIPSNIAEGSGRQTKKDFINFLCIARGSNFELQTQLEICVKIKYLTKADIRDTYNLTTEVSKMLSGLIKSLSD